MIGLLLVALVSCEKEPTIPAVPPPCVLDDFEMKVVEDLNQYAHPISSADPSSPLEEFLTLDSILAGVKVVGLGEATHGTKEFFQMKHRLFQYLVEHHGYRAIVFEATYGGAMFVNNYIQNGVGQLDDVVDKLQYWTWDTDEVKAMIRWMKAYNETLPQHEKLYFLGADCQSTEDEMNMVRTYLKDIDPAYKWIADSLYQPFKDFGFEYQEEMESFKNEIRGNVLSVFNHIAERKEDYIALSDSQRYEIALQAARVIVQTEEVFSGRNLDARDVAMAQNTLWASRVLGDAKVAFWAHNYHVMTHPWGWMSSGNQLRQDIGQAYLIVGFSFSSGSFNAVERYSNGPNSYGDLRPHTVLEMLCGSTNFVFSKADKRQFFININTLPSQTYLKTWVSRKKAFFSAGATYNRSTPNAYYNDISIDRHFDILVHFNATTYSEF